MATVGGNIVNASPAADVVPVLLALDATVTCVGLQGERSLLIEEFASAPGVTARRPGELLTCASFPGPSPHSATAFLKAGRRRAMEISLVCVAVRLTLDTSRERCLDARIALGAVAPTTLRALAAERSLQGGRSATRFWPRPVARRPARMPADHGRPGVGASPRPAGGDALVPRALARCRERIQRAA